MHPGGPLEFVTGPQEQAVPPLLACLGPSQTHRPREDELILLHRPTAISDSRGGEAGRAIFSSKFSCPGDSDGEGAEGVTVGGGRSEVLLAASPDRGFGWEGLYGHRAGRIQPTWQGPLKSPMGWPFLGVPTGNALPSQMSSSSCPQPAPVGFSSPRGTLGGVASLSWGRLITHAWRRREG